MCIKTSVITGAGNERRVLILVLGSRRDHGNQAEHAQRGRVQARACLTLRGWNPRLPCT